MGLLESVSRGAVVVLAVVLCVESYSSWTSSAGNVVIHDENGKINCDSLICPKNSYTCHVSKANNPSNFSEIETHRRCLDSNGTILAKEDFFEPNPTHTIVNINLVSGGGGFSSANQLSPEQVANIENRIADTQQQIYHQLENLFNDVRPLTFPHFPFIPPLPFQQG